jgi:uncharacterized protein (TIGR03067 family)
MLLGVAATASGQTAKDDQQLIQGTWECVISLNDGKPVTPYVGVQAEMRGNRLTWIFPRPDGTKKVSQARFRLDPSQSPKHFDWSYDEKPDDVHERLYILQGDILIWSTNLKPARPRPASFTAGQWLFVMKRVKE